MGGGPSKSPPPILTYIDIPEYPGGNDDTRVNSLSIPKSEGCADCRLKVEPGISTSSVNISRLFGDVRTCSLYATDTQRVAQKEMSARDFVGNMQAGNYLRPTKPGFCEEIRFPDEIAAIIKTPADLVANQDKALTVRIRKISGGGFSMDTKARFVPNIPFKMKFNETDILVKSITVYHPAPLRINDVQADAVISLNDPSDKTVNPELDSEYHILIPIVAGSANTPSARFFNRLATHIPTVADADYMTGLFDTADIPTGKDWSLTQLFPPKDPAEGCCKVIEPGYFKWEGVDSYDLEALPAEQINATNTHKIKNPALLQQFYAYYKLAQIAPSAYSYPQMYLEPYVWVESSGARKPKYIMMEKPLPVDPTDLAILVNTLPVTDWKQAIHAIDAGSTTDRENMQERIKSLTDLVKSTTTDWWDAITGGAPATKKARSMKNLKTAEGKLREAKATLGGIRTNTKRILYKRGPAEDCNVPMRENFTPKREGTDPECNPYYQNLAKYMKREFTTERLFATFFNILIMVAIAIGAYIALAAVARMMDVNYSDFAKGAGKVIGIWAKKLNDLKMPGGPTGLSGLGSLASLAGKGGLAGVLTPTAGQAIAASSASITPALGNIAGTVATPATGVFSPDSVKTRMADAREAEMAQDSVRGSFPKTRRTRKNFGMPELAKESEPTTPATANKWDKVSTPYLGKTGFTRRGGNRTRRGRGRGDSTQTDSH